MAQVFSLATRGLVSSEQDERMVARTAQNVNEPTAPGKDLECKAGDEPALRLSSGPCLLGTVLTVSPHEFSKMSGIGENRVRAWCHLPDFPAHREGWRYRINTELAVNWLKQRAQCKEGMDENLLGRLR